MVAHWLTDGAISLWTNGKPDATSNRDMPTQILSGHMPMVLHPKATDVLVIGLASGVTCGALLQHPVRSVDAVDVVGIATDHCVRATALDATREGFDTRVLLDLTAGVAPATTDKAMAELGSAGIDLVGEPVLGS